MFVMDHAGEKSRAAKGISIQRYVTHLTEYLNTVITKSKIETQFRKQLYMTIPFNNWFFWAKNASLIDTANQ